MPLPAAALLLVVLSLVRLLKGVVVEGIVVFLFVFLLHFLRGRSELDHKKRIGIVAVPKSRDKMGRLELSITFLSAIIIIIQ